MRQKLLMLSLWLCFTANAVMAQVKSASGVVYSAEDGEPLIGASVKVKGTTTGMSKYTMLLSRKNIKLKL